jgi:di/tricarboxylate transporter
MNALKKTTAYILVFIVLIITVLAILGIWDVVNFENILRRSITSLFVIFISAVIVLFIFSVLIKENEPKKHYFEEKQKDKVE